MKACDWVAANVLSVCLGLTASAWSQHIPEAIPTTRDRAPVQAGQALAPSWGPPAVDEVEPRVAPAVICPQERVLDEAGSRLNDLLENLARFDAIETLVHEEQDRFGKPLTRTTRKFSYLAAISPLRGRAGEQIPAIREDRQSLDAMSNFPGGIETVGLPTLAFLFHPNMRESFVFACEGLGDWQGKPAWLVRFRQRDDRPNYLQHYRIGDSRHPVPLRGRAWLAADTFQVIHMQADLVRPMPEIKLLRQHFLVDYGTVKFQKKDVDLWLPRKAELYFHFQGRRYYRRHSFEDFRLFSTDTTQKVTLPAVQDSPQKDPPPKPDAVPPHR